MDQTSSLWLGIIVVLAEDTHAFRLEPFAFIAGLLDRPSGCGRSGLQSEHPLVQVFH